jgi:hypothetical protein
MSARVLCILFAGVSWIAAPNRTDADSGWREFQPPNQPFSIRMPAEILQSRRTSHTLIGSVKTDVWTSAIELGKLSVSITHLPRMATWFTSNDGLYEKALDKMMEELGAELGRVEEIDHGLFERKIFYRVPARDGHPLRSGRALIGLHDRRIVVLNGISPPDGAEQVERFFKGLSFQEMSASRD